MFKSDSSYQDDFWGQLQREWDKAAEDNPSLSWLKGTPIDPLSDVTRCLFYHHISQLIKEIKSK